MVLASQFAPIRGIWAGFCASAGCAHRGAIHEGAIPIDLVGCLEFRQQCFENALPNPGLLPLAKATQARVSGRKIARGREPAPRDTRPQDKKNAGDNSARLTW